MNSHFKDTGPAGLTPQDGIVPGRARVLLESNIGQSLDRLVDYLIDNDVSDIHHLIMGEVERRLLIKVLEKNRGNKLQAARQLGMSRNTFHRKLGKLR
ncbi:MAG: helix-turn-helix domain-containing protein [Pseudomonadota bacterium]